jgi:hypothetical protein
VEGGHGGVDVVFDDNGGGCVRLDDAFGRYALARCHGVTWAYGSLW